MNYIMLKKLDSIQQYIDDTKTIFVCLTTFFKCTVTIFNQITSSKLPKNLTINKVYKRTINNCHSQQHFSMKYKR